MHNVLLAEDDRDLLHYLTLSLEKYRDRNQFTIIPARDGQEAIEILKETPIAVVVTDVQMPRVNGILLLAYVNTYHPDLPCFVITSFGTSRLKAKLPKDLLRFFQKPFKVEDLAQSIMAVIHRERPRDEAKGISLASLLYLIQMEQSSCTVEIESPEAHSGELYFEDGILYDAVCGHATGEAAALDLISRKASTYRLRIVARPWLTRKINTDIQDLIQNALIVQD